MGNNRTIICADGFSMSVQANAGAYCTPRIDNAQKYVAVEVGYPNGYDSLLAAYAENKEDYTGTVYPWVPADTVTLVIIKHGGIISGDLPNGVPYLEADDENR